MKIIRIKNNTNANRSFYNTILTPAEYYTIPSDKVDVWSNDIDLQLDILDGYGLVNDGSDDFDDYNEGLNYLKGVSQKFNQDGSLSVAATPILGSRKTIVSHNYCDPTTWYSNSIGEDGDGYGQVFSTIDAYVTYQSPDDRVNWIDASHGRITGEHLLTQYQVQVTVDGYAKIEDTDYTVNYQDGYVVFDSALTSSNVVKASFSYEAGSTFALVPASGKTLRILYTEVQFGISTKISHCCPIRFQVWVYNPYDLPNKFPYGSPELYKSENDIVNISNGGEHIVQFGGLAEDVVILPFKYAAVTDLSSAVGAEIRISIDSDTPLDGYYATMTAYCLSEDL